jgi:hypothetical protein
MRSGQPQNVSYKVNEQQPRLYFRLAIDPVYFDANPYFLGHS